MLKKGKIFGDIKRQALCFTKSANSIACQYFYSNIQKNT